MDIHELESLAYWFKDLFDELSQKYQAVYDPINHNAHQPNKLEVETPLNELLEFLHSMRFDNLSIQQILVLENIGVSIYLGNEGVTFLNDLIKTATYDPVAASREIESSISIIRSTQEGFKKYIAALNALDVRQFEAENDEIDRVVIRIGFQNDASIENIAEWKDSAKEWYDIIRGLSLAVDEAPENTKVIGAATGSVILILAGTAAITGLLALISKNVITAATETVQLLNAIEDLRHKKWLNNTIEKELKKKIESTKASALNAIVSEVKNKTRDLDGEKIAALENSVKRLLEFNEKGGNVDFVSPEHETEHDIDDTDPIGSEANPLAEVQGLIRDYQSARERLKLLTHQS